MNVSWDRGGTIALGDLARRLDRHLLTAMKRECGGLQTLLKNYRYIFNISNGEVSLQVQSTNLLVLTLFCFLFLSL